MSQSSELRVGVVGAGVMGQRRAKVVHADPEARLVAVADIDRSRASEIAQQWGTDTCQVTEHWEELIADKTIDVIIVATFNDMLSPITIAALESGKQVLCEKPMGSSLAQAQSMAKVATSTGQLLQMGFNHRHHPAIRKAHQLLNEGAIGEPMYIRACYGHGGRPGYENEWRSDPKVAGGGQLMDQGVHALDLAHWFMGNFSKVFARLPTFFWPIDPLEDNAFVILWRDDGKTAQLHTTITQWRNRFEFEIFGKAGYLSIQGLGKSYGLEKLTLGQRLPQGGPPAETVWEFPGDDISWQAEWDDFRAALRTGQPPLCSAQASLPAMQLADAIYRSARVGQVVDVQSEAVTL